MITKLNIDIERDTAQIEDIERGLRKGFLDVAAVEGMYPQAKQHNLTEQPEVTGLHYNERTIFIEFLQPISDPD